ncbi:MlaD family protein [Chryseobacterium sp. WX]|uniref:MlaD family protein n=1 Tax=Chryseobacterium sp. WX TaxID=3031803 RepID=UPI00240A5BAA|nr:MlaD family protein [Chryseobacterium sp. WX]WFB68273.1 MlaD family protein [Chryseobacterium sp. WX]
MKNESSNNLKLGVFVIAGIILFILTIYFIGLNRNIFGTNFILRSEFENVSGLKQGSNVRLSGINIGTVSKIDFISDSLVMVKMSIKKNVQRYIKTDAVASIASDGLVGDKVLVISPGTGSSKVVGNNAVIASYKTTEIEDVLFSIKKSADNIQTVTTGLVDFTAKMNNKDGLLVKVMTSKDFANQIDKTVQNIQTSVNDFASFTPTLRNKDGIINKIFTDKNWSDNVESSVLDLKNSSRQIRIFAEKLNDKNNILSKITTNDTLAASLEKTLDNLEKSSDDLKKFTSKINNEENVVSKLVDNPRLGRSVDSTINNIGKGVDELRELEAAARNNFLLKGYFKKKAANK